MTTPSSPSVPSRPAVSPTPGPYYVTEYDNAFHVCRRWDRDVRPANTATYGSCLGAHVASVPYNGGVPTREQAEANARLIASAPATRSALIGARDALREAAKMFRLNGQDGHAVMCDRHADAATAALALVEG